MTGQEVVTYHAAMTDLDPASAYAYQVLADGADPVAGSSGPARPEGLRSGSPASAIRPSPPGWDRAPTRSVHANAGYVVAPSRPPNPCSIGNGPQGYPAYETWFSLLSRVEPEFQGNWYSFSIGSVGVVSLNNDDVCYQAGSFSQYRLDHLMAGANRNDYIRGYSDGAQKRWLESTLSRLRADPRIDWIVVVMHQVAMSSANFNGADLGIREEFLPLFDTYGVDLVVAGHEHHFERTHAVRGVDPSNIAPNHKPLLTPVPRSTDLRTVDTTKGTVHMILGGGGHSYATPPGTLDDSTHGVVIYDVAPPAANGSRASLKVVNEPSHWSAVRDLTHKHGFGVFDLDPGEEGGTTTISFTYFGTVLGSASYQPYDTVVITRPRSDA